MNLGRDLGRCAESSVVEHSQILLNSSAGGFRRQPFLALDGVLPVGIRLDQAGINCKAFAADQALFHAAVSKTRDRSRGNGHAGSSRRWNDRGHRRRARAGRTTCSQIEVDLFAEAPLGAD